MLPQRTAQEELVSKWLEDTKHRSGFVQCQAGGDAKEVQPGVGHDPYEKPREFEFRISVLFNKNELNGAAEAIATVFSKEKYKGIDFKCFVLNDPDTRENDHGISEHDGVTSSDNERDQRGKEICVYMSWDAANCKYIRTPAEWKELMLDLWKALQDAEVLGIGSAMTPAGDRMVPAEIGLIVPITYTAFKPFQNPHGILFQTDYNPFNHADPLEGMVITRQDLIERGINYDAMVSERLQFASAHQIEHKQLLLNKIENLKKQLSSNKIGTGTERLERLFRTATETEDLNKRNAILKAIRVLIPCELNQKLTHHYNEFIDGMIARPDNENCLGTLKHIIENVLVQRQAMIERIYKDFVDDSVRTNDDAQTREQKSHVRDIKYFFSDVAALEDVIGMAKTEDTVLFRLCDQFPQEMQHIYRQCIHLIREQKEIIKYSDPSYRLKLDTAAKFVVMINDDKFWVNAGVSTAELKNIKAIQAEIKGFYNFAEINNLKCINKLFATFAALAQLKPGFFAVPSYTTAYEFLKKCLNEVRLVEDVPTALEKNPSFLLLFAHYQVYNIDCRNPLRR